MNNSLKNLILISSSLLLISCSNSSPSSSNLNNVSPQENNSAEMQPQELPISAQAIIKGKQIDLEVAKTREQQRLGLMFRKSLEPNRGMLFSFSPPRVTRFWMRNVIIPLDLLFIQDGKIKAIIDNVPPCKSDPCPVYSSDIPIDMVIELKGGRASELGFSVDDLVEINFLDDSSQK